MLLKRLLTDPKPLRRARQLLHLVTHLDAHRAFGAAAREAEARGLTGAGRLSRFKYLGTYLAEFLSAEQRRRIIMYHYAYLACRLPAEGCAQWGRPTELWRRVDGPSGRSFRITLDEPAAAVLEGERQLRFLMDDQLLFSLTFAVVPEAEFFLGGSALLFVGGLQGGLGCRQEIREAAKANGEIAPVAMLLIAARALAAALGVPRLIGISTEQQAAMGYARHRISLDYDALWEVSGAVRAPQGFFVLDAVPSEKAEEPIRGNHRARTRRKRLLKAALAAELEQAARERFRPQSEPPCPPANGRRPLATQEQARRAA